MLDFHKLVKELDENDLMSLHQELVSRNIYNNLVDLSDVGNDINRIRNIVPVALQRLNFDDIHQIAPDAIKQAVSSFIESETKTSEIPDTPFQDDNQTQYISTEEKRKQEISDLTKRLGTITVEKTYNNRVLPQHRDEIMEITTKLNKIYKIPISKITEFTNISGGSTAGMVREYLKKHPNEEHRWSEAAKNKAVAKADETLTKAAGKKADELVESYMSLGEWVSETYTLMAHSLGMSLRELVELGIDSYNPSIHIEFLNLQREKDDLKEINHIIQQYLIYQDMQIQEFELIIISLLKQQNPDAVELIDMESAQQIIPLLTL